MSSLMLNRPLQLDCNGRVVLSDAELYAIERSVIDVSAAGDYPANDGCAAGGTNRLRCSNAINCDGSSNGACANLASCSGATNTIC
jgi:hypothetical protein